jgi:hypothetical protein
MIVRAISQPANQSESLDQLVRIWLSAGAPEGQMC